MKVLHTSDWHLGRQLFGRKRYAEFEAFLQWLTQTIEQQGIEVLLVAGDVFDTSTPSNRAQELYYRFLCHVAASSTCCHIVIIAGNHDSPTFLEAPKALLRALQVHVIGQAGTSPEDEVLVLRDAQGVAELIVCAVPYLRDRDLRTAQAGEGLQDKERQLLDGIHHHYAAVAEHAVALRQQAQAGAIPIIGMGHLFAAGGQTVDGDGVRELYVGSLAHVGSNLFPTSFDYVALGHLHVPQVVGGQPTIRYSGSPIPMGFGEALQRKSVCIVQWPSATPRQTSPVNTALDMAAPPQSITLVEVPTFQHLVRIRGEWEQIAKQLRETAQHTPTAWLEVTYTGHEVLSDLRERIDLALQGSALEVLRVRNQQVTQRLLAQTHADEHLDDLSPAEVFERCLTAHDIPDAQRPALRLSYNEVLHALAQADHHAE